LGAPLCTVEGNEPLTAYYPVSLNLEGRACLVVGGGPVAVRKASGLLRCGAVVAVVAPEVCDAMVALAPHTIARRPYRAGEAATYRLVVSATGKADVDRAVHADAEAAGVWVNSADDEEHCSFILPAVYRDGPVTIAVSTGGTSPALASWLRDRLADEAGGLATLAALLAEARGRLRADGRSTEEVDWGALLDGPLPSLIDAGRLEQARALVTAATGVDLA
jgi:precorrin-2 dehydrogenase/sirohydrochlorin ferrochelatase